MDVSGKIKQETKTQIGNLLTECQVLENLLNERRTLTNQVLSEIIRGLTANPDLYHLTINVSRNTWNLEVKKEILHTVILPGQIPTRN